MPHQSINTTSAAPQRRAKASQEHERFMPTDIVPDAAGSRQRLPAEWREGLSRNAPERPSGRPVSRDDVRKLRAWAQEGEPCGASLATAELWCDRIAEAARSGGVHDQALRAVYAVFGDMAAGHTGAWESLKLIRRAFYAATRRPGRRRREWRDIVDGALPYCAESVRGDPCAEYEDGPIQPAGMSAEWVAAGKKRAAQRRLTKYGPTGSGRNAQTRGDANKSKRKADNG